MPLNPLNQFISVLNGIIYIYLNQSNESMVVFLCLSRWLIDMEGAPGTLYEGEKFQLLFKFSGRYPFDSPQVNYESS